MKPNNVAIRKRTQIASANQAMFIWIAIASALIGAAAVVSIFLFQQIVYTEKVLAEMQNTVSVLDHNNSVVSSLENEVAALDANSVLLNNRANETDQALQVVLDALPSSANSLALGASLQDKLLVGIGGLSIESMQVDPVVGVETLTTAPAASTTDDSSTYITFKFVVTGDETAMKQVLDNLERSIRTIQVLSVGVEIQNTGPQMTVTGRAFYEPERTIQLEDKVVPR